MREAGTLTRYRPIVVAVLSPLEQQFLPRFVAEARRALGERFVRVVLFGSRARGDSDEHSDVDLLVVTRGHSRAEEQAVIDAAAALSLESELRLAPVVRDEHWLSSDWPIVREIAREGVPL